MSNKTIAFIDYANLRASVKSLGKFLDLKILRDILVNKYKAKEVRFYYGLDKTDEKSHNFLDKITTFGYIVTSRDVKYIRVNLVEVLRKQLTARVLDQLDRETRVKLDDLISRLEKKNIPILIPKANMDSEITMDMVLNEHKYRNYILFSGDSDFAPIINFLVNKGIQVSVVSLRSHTAGEIFKSGAKFIELRRFSEDNDGVLKKQRPQRGP